MANQKPDYSLERDGVTLREWLWRLLDEDREVRVAAGNALQSMERGIPSVKIDWENIHPFPDFKAQRSRFEQAVRSEVGSENFNTAEFVRKLVAYRLALKQDWKCKVKEVMAMCSKRDQKFDRISDRLMNRIKSSVTKDHKKQALKRFKKVEDCYICGAFKQDESPMDNSEAITPAATAAYMIFDILDRELLAAPDALQLMLDRKYGLRHDALMALTRIGPPAVFFARQIIEEIERIQSSQEGNYYFFDGGQALGCIGRGNSDAVSSIIRLLESDVPAHRAAAAQAAEYMGPDVCEREEEIITHLERMIALEEENFAALPALASVGRHFQCVRSKVIDLTKPRPPKWRTYECADMEMRYDKTMYERGTAISSLKYFYDYSEECIPTLVSSIDDFEEYDPDECYGGPQGRISSVISCFGPRAAAAAVPLVSCMEEEIDELPTQILEALVDIGPAAVDALPRLFELRDIYQSDVPLQDLDSVIVDRVDDYVGWVIQRIRGQQ